MDTFDEVIKIPSESDPERPFMEIYFEDLSAEAQNRLLKILDADSPESAGIADIPIGVVDLLGQDFITEVYFL